MGVGRSLLVLTTPTYPGNLSLSRWVGKLHNRAGTSAPPTSHDEDMTAVTPDATSTSETGVTASLSTIFDELTATAAAVVDDSAAGLDAVADTLSGANRVFVLGAGRSGLALQ